MRKFETKVQELKYKVLLQVSKQTWEGRDSFSVFNEIANTIVKKGEPTMRCCVYKERAIVADRIRVGLGGKREKKNIIEIIDIACDECPEAGHKVTDLCRGCISHWCIEVCKLNAITFGENQKATINKDKCIECGKCASACPYNAIHNFIRPCEKACPVDAISASETGAATINEEKCIECGACVYQCPFGATVDKSLIVDVINILKTSENNRKYKTHAIVAPAIASQINSSLGKVFSGIKELGFSEVHEVAKAADLIAYEEAKELIEKGFLTTSCCPAFVSYIHSKFPEMAEHISSNLSPMAMMGKILKDKDPNCKVVFIGPCTAKKSEVLETISGEYVDSVLTFEELPALLDSKNIDLDIFPEDIVDQASRFGRGFANSGGVTAAVEQAIKELGVTDFEFKPLVCDSIAKCKSALLRASKGVLPFNFIEGMACEGGCANGAGCLIHGPQNAKAIKKYSEAATKETLV